MKPSEILNTNNPLTREEMQQYLDGKLSPSEKKLVEEKMVDDEFSSEASEGFMENHVAFAETSSLNAAWDASRNTATHSGKIKAGGTNYKYWFIGTLAVTVISISVIAYLLINDDQTRATTQPATAELKEENNKNEISSSELPLAVMTEEEFKEEIIEIKEAKHISQNKQITYEKTVAAQAKTVESEIPAEVVTIPDPDNVDVIKPDEIEVKEDKKIVESNVKMLYIKNLKAVDYSELYTNHIAKKEWILTGTTADKENSASEGVIPEHVVKYIPYKDFLIEGLTLFSKNDYKGSLGHLLTILQQYPDDANASFYSGLCYYNLGKTKQAIAMFDKTIVNSINTFKEEAEWYKSLSLLEYGKKSEAKELMKKIADENGFYGKAAREKLKTLK